MAFFAGLAAADTFLMPTAVDWNRGESIWINQDGSDQYAYFAGVVAIELSQNGQQYNRDTLCVDLFTDINLGVNYGTEVLRPDQVPGKNLQRVSWLIDNALLPTQGPSYPSVLSSSDWVTTAAQGAGIQLAVWDITHDGGDGFYSGRVQASTASGQLTDPTALAWAETYEALSVGHQSDQAFVYQNWDLTTMAPAQMLEGPMFLDHGPSPAPESATYLLTGISLIVLASRTHRRARPVR